MAAKISVLGTHTVRGRPYLYENLYAFSKPMCLPNFTLLSDCLVDNKICIRDSCIVLLRQYNSVTV